jgi:ankyrin repeat protein
MGNLNVLSYFIERALADHETDISSLVNSRDPKTECTLLHLIVSNNANPIQLLKLLLEQGADTTARNIYNIQAIHAVLLRCPQPLEPIRLLLDYEADPNARDGDGWTPLHYAARFSQHPETTMKLLVDRGADINAIDSTHKTALFCLLANGDHSKALDYLIHSAKANVKIQGNFLDSTTRRTHPGTLLLQAAKYGRLDCLRILISSASALESLEAVTNKRELESAIDLVRQQLLEVTSRNYEEKLRLIIMIFEDLIRKFYGSRSLVEEEQQQKTSLQRRPSLLKRMGSLWKNKR